MLLRKLEAGGGFAIGPYQWSADSPVCEVPDDLGHDLLRLGGYEIAEPEPDGTAPEEPAPKDSAPKRPARGKTAAAKSG